MRVTREGASLYIATVMPALQGRDFAVKREVARRRSVNTLPWIAENDKTAIARRYGRR